jgi:hypothetical protein
MDEVGDHPTANNETQACPLLLEKPYETCVTHQAIHQGKQKKRQPESRVTY